MILHIRPEKEIREYRFSFTPQNVGNDTCPETSTIAVAYRTSVDGARKIIDSFRHFHDGFVRQQFIETDSNLVTIPNRVRWESDRYPIGYGTQDKGFAIVRRQRSLLTGTKPVLDILLDFAQKWCFCHQSKEKQVLISTFLCPS